MHSHRHSHLCLPLFAKSADQLGYVWSEMNLRTQTPIKPIVSKGQGGPAEH